MTALLPGTELKKLLKDRNVVLGFPGQASQYVGMGQELYKRYGFLRELFELAEDITKIALRKLCFEGPMDKLTETINAQPAILLCSLAAYDALRAELEEDDLRSINLKYITGHSLGEISAIVAIGGISREHGFKLVKKRAELMADAPRGAMLAVLSRKSPINAGELEKLVNKISEEHNETLVIANYNSPYQIIVSGTIRAISILQTELKERNLRGIKLNVSGPFHSPLMQGAQKQMEEYLQDFPISDISVPLMSPTTLKEEQSSDNLRALIAQGFTSSVKWTQTVSMLKDRVNMFIEVGPKDVLSKLVRAITQDIETLSFG